MRVEVRDDEQWWLERLAELRQIEARIRATEDPDDPYPRERGHRILRRALVAHANVETDPPLDERADVYLSYVMRQLERGLRGAGNGNDYFDGRHLQHVAWPAFH
jgi:hypothetical protein